jgi:predicted AlkP superfamily pyrophosphatase or phosphodiesterase
MLTESLFFLSSALLTVGVHANGDSPTYKHVAFFSVDGLHNSDIDTFLAKGKSNISTMLQNGYRYTNAFTSFPSDSFPGTLALITGALPVEHGVWYDDIWDRSLFPPESDCKGLAGAEGTNYIAIN